MNNPHATLSDVSPHSRRRAARPALGAAIAAIMIIAAALVGSSVLAKSPAGADGNTSYVATTPSRILDTRDGTGAPAARLEGGSLIELQVGGRGGIPSDAGAVALNVTVTDPSDAGWMAVWPSGEPRPLASNVNFTTGATVANLAISRLGADGRVRLFLSGGSAHVIVDAQGWFPSGAGFSANTPSRVLDTRDSGIPLGPDQDLVVPIAGRGGVPSGATAVIVNLTVTRPASAGYLTARPSGTSLPLASNVNYGPGDTTANVAVVNVGSDGAIVLRSSGGATHAIVDVLGWFSGEAGVGAQTPTRLLDTRSGAPMSGDGTLRLSVVGRAGIPSSGVRAVMLNVTLTDPSGSTWLVAFPSGLSRPLASTVNTARGRTVANLTMVDVGPDGGVALYLSSGAAHVIVDVQGWIGERKAAPTPTTPATTAPWTTAPPTTAPPTTAPPTTASPTTAPSGMTTEQTTFLDAINAARATGRACGAQFMAAAPALRWDSRLGTAAQLHSQDQFNRATMTHTGSDGSNAGQRITRQGYTWRAYGENVAWNYSTVSSVIGAWLTSEGHCRNLMNPAFRDVGMARVGTSPLQPPGVYWTQVFASAM